MKYLLQAIVLILFLNSGLASTLNVPGDFTSVQTAVENAVDGDTIIVSDGVYFERIDLLGKSIVVASLYAIDGDSAHISGTVIDSDTLAIGASETGSVLRASGSFPSEPEAVVIGLTLQNGQADEGGGVYCREYDLTLRNCVLKDNWASQGQVAFLFHSATSMTLDSCEIYGGGGSISSFYSWLKTDKLIQKKCTISNSRIYDTHIRPRYKTAIVSCTLSNGSVTAFQSDYSITGSSLDSCLIEGIDGASLSIDSSALTACDVNVDRFSSFEVSSSLVTGTIDVISYAFDASNSTFIGTVHLGMGSSSYPATFDKCIIVTDGSAAITCGEQQLLTLSCCDLSGCDSSSWLSGSPTHLDTFNIVFADPLFCDKVGGDYHLMAASPCGELSSPCDTLIGVYGVGCRYKYGDADGSGETDIDDIIFILEYIFSAGYSPLPLESADADCSGDIDIDDAVYLVSYIFSGGPEPCTI